MENDLKTIKNALVFIVIFIAVYTTTILSSILIPLALALFIVLLIEPLLHWLKTKNINFTISVIMILLIGAYLINVFGSIIYNTAQSIVEQQDRLGMQLSAKLKPLMSWLSENTALLTNLNEGKQSLGDLISKDWIITTSGTVAGLLGNLGQLIFMTALYFFAFLGGILNYQNFIKYVSKNKDDGRMLRTFNSVKASINMYMKVKFLVSLATGFCFSLMCWIFNVDFPFFWGFLAFSFNFIPTVGSFIATVPPVLLGIIQIDSGFALLAFISLLIITQIIFGNIIEPRLLGHSFAINTVFVILSLVFWGYVWGIVGMILSTPILVFIKAILDQFPEYQIVSRLMGVTKD